MNSSMALQQLDHQPNTTLSPRRSVGVNSYDRDDDVNNSNNDYAWIGYSLTGLAGLATGAGATIAARINGKSAQKTNYSNEYIALINRTTEMESRIDSLEETRGKQLELLYEKDSALIVTLQRAAYAESALRDFGSILRQFVAKSVMPLVEKKELMSLIDEATSKIGHFASVATVEMHQRTDTRTDTVVVSKQSEEVKPVKP